MTFHFSVLRKHENCIFYNDCVIAQSPHSFSEAMLHSNAQCVEFIAKTDHLLLDTKLNYKNCKTKCKIMIEIHLIFKVSSFNETFKKIIWSSLSVTNNF